MDSKTSRRVKDIYKGNMLIDMSKGIVHIGEVIEMVMDMFEDVMRGGPLVREPCTKVKVMLMDLSLHEDAIHRGPAQLYPAVRDGIRLAMLNGNAILYEPVQVMQFEAPAEFMGDISKLIQNKRGQLLEVNQDENHVSVKCKLPVAQMFGLTSELRSATSGRGVQYMIDQSFERMPDELQQKMLNQIRERKGLKVNEEGIAQPK